MQFRLTYEGPLPSRGDRAMRQQIREHFHPQLKRLWEYEPLQAYAAKLLTARGELSVLVEQSGQSFAPLVGQVTGLGAELDILVLRTQHPKSPVIHDGDIDNRIKTLLDGLRRPRTDQEVDSAGRASSAEDPTFVLLDDDRHVSRLNIDVDRWLVDVAQDHVHVVIRVTTKIERGMLLNAFW